MFAVTPWYFLSGGVCIILLFFSLYPASQEHVARCRSHSPYRTSLGTDLRLCQCWLVGLLSCLHRPFGGGSPASLSPRRETCRASGRKHYFIELATLFILELACQPLISLMIARLESRSASHLVSNVASPGSLTLRRETLSASLDGLHGCSRWCHVVWWIR